MAKIKYTATDANGLVHTRSSARTYTHMVVARPSYENAIARANRVHMPTEKSNFVYYRECAEHGYSREVYKQGRPTYTSEESWAEQLAADKVRAAERLGGATTLAEYAALNVERALAAVEKQRLEGRFDRFFDMGWCGRPDLADKLASKTVAEGYAEVAILPVN